MNKIMDSVEAIKNFTESTKVFFEGVGKVFYYAAHLTELGLMVWNGILKYGYPVFTLICLGGIIAYLIGYTKGKKIAFGSFMIYVVMNMINAGLH